MPKCLPKRGQSKIHTQARVKMVELLSVGLAKGAFRSQIQTLKETQRGAISMHSQVGKVLSTCCTRVWTPLKLQVASVWPGEQRHLGGSWSFLRAPTPKDIRGPRR